MDFPAPDRKEAAPQPAVYNLMEALGKSMERNRRAGKGGSNGKYAGNRGRSSRRSHHRAG